MESILDQCEKALADINHAKNVLSDPYAPQHEWPIRLIEKSEKILIEYKMKIVEENFTSSQYPLLFIHVNLLKEQKAHEEKVKRIQDSPEFKLEEKKRNLTYKKNLLSLEKSRMQRLRQDLAASEAAILKMEIDIKEEEKSLSVMPSC